MPRIAPLILDTETASTAVQTSVPGTLEPIFRVPWQSTSSKAFLGCGIRTNHPSTPDPSEWISTCDLEFADPRAGRPEQNPVVVGSHLFLDPAPDVSSVILAAGC